MQNEFPDDLGSENCSWKTAARRDEIQPFGIRRTDREKKISVSHMQAERDESGTWQRFDKYLTG